MNLGKLRHLENVTNFEKEYGTEKSYAQAITNEQEYRMKFKEKEMIKNRYKNKNKSKRKSLK